MSSHKSEKESKASHSFDQSRGNRAAFVDAEDNPTCVDDIPDPKALKYPKKYGAVFAQLAIKKQMLNEEKEKKYREEDERKVEEKKNEDLDGDGKQGDWDNDDDDDWEDVDFSEDETVLD